MASRDEDPERRSSRSWAYARGLSARIRRLETWRAEERAVTGWRRWIVPTALSAIATTVTVINLLYPRH
ncbi:hypothetical protein GCM10023196_036810 [Actinoallomurus vinaceus]|uniref:Uncharacterized protein n=1 Tax=Actinoallomurus vinaceus TaxID=1080074 RepID=A0ABP8U971_9ACTN